MESKIELLPLDLRKSEEFTYGLQKRMYQLRAKEDIQVCGITIPKGTLGGYTPDPKQINMSNSWIGEGVIIVSDDVTIRDSIILAECQYNYKGAVPIIRLLGTTNIQNNSCIKLYDGSYINNGFISNTRIENISLYSVNAEMISCEVSALKTKTPSLSLTGATIVHSIRLIHGKFFLDSAVEIHAMHQVMLIHAFIRSSKDILQLFFNNKQIIFYRQFVPGTAKSHIALIYNEVSCIALEFPTTYPKIFNASNVLAPRMLSHILTLMEDT